jgi:hypothetical protein
MFLACPLTAGQAGRRVAHSADEHSLGPIKVVALGSGPYDPNATRWGDYSYGWQPRAPLSRQTVDGL